MAVGRAEETQSAAVRRLRQWALQARYIGSHPLGFVRHRARSRVLLGPGSLDFAGGVFNPGAVRLGDGSVIALAKGQERHWIDAAGSADGELITGEPVLLHLDDRCEVVSAERVALAEGPGPDTAWEDFRLFRFGDELWAGHTIALLADDGRRQVGARLGVARLDLDTSTLHPLGTPSVDIELGAYEKNWLFHEDDGGALVAIHGVAPWRVLRGEPEDPLTMTTAVHRDRVPGLADPGGFGTFTGLSTVPVDWDDEHWLILIHQVDPGGMGRLFLQWGVLVCRRDLRPVAVARRPWLVGWGSRGRLRGALYASSVVTDGDDIHVFCGEGDSYCTVVVLSRRDVDRCWRSLD